MPVNRYEKAVKLLKDFKEKNGPIITFDELKKEIEMKIGAHENKTVRPYIQLIRRFELITFVDKTETTKEGFKINDELF